MAQEHLADAVLTEAVRSAPAEFATRDISENARVTAAHEVRRHHPRFHVEVGSWLSRNADSLSIRRLGSSRRGATWRRMHASDAAPSRTHRRGIGPQVATDDPWTARMRLHQSWWRHAVLEVPYGTGPTAGSKRQLGSMLDEEGDRLGANFLNDAARTAYARRAGRKVEPFRARRNLLSSQPMCFNIFGPMSLDLDLATRVMQAWFPNEVERVTEVRLEYAPSPQREFLDDGTSFDAFVAYDDLSGRRSFLGIETKLTEPFTQTGGYHQKPAYRRVTEAPDSPWRPGSLDALGDPTWCQLWRNHLLVEALSSHSDHDYPGGGRLLVLHHQLDPGCGHAVAGYRQFLTDPGHAQVLELTLDVAVQRLQALANGEQELRWGDDLWRRYADLTGSSDLPQASATPTPAPA